MKKYIIYGNVTTELTVEIGTFETNLSLHDCWDMIMQIFDDGVSYPEGLFAKRSKE
jgi:hypothetical protein